MIFIVGGKGFLGSAFVRYCNAQNLPHTVIELDNYGQYVGANCDVLINANGNSKKYLAQQDPLAEFDLSVRSVYASLQDFKCGLYIYLSSCDVYPDSTAPETSKEDLVIDPTRQTTYGFHKYLAEQCVRKWSKTWLILRLGGFVGPGLRKNAIYDLLRGDPLWVDPASEFQYMHTDDLPQIALSLAQDRTALNEVFNVTGMGVISPAEAARLLDVPVRARPGSPQVRYEACLQKLASRTVVPSTRLSVERFLREQVPDWQPRPEVA
jgi:nucleoside-diphosphate-sugar epimerase